MNIAGIGFPVSGYIFKNFNMMLGRSLHEANELDYFVRLANQNNAEVFWDVGANVGLYGFSFVSAAPNRTAVLYEPDPDNLAALRHTISSNALESRVELRPCAVAAETGSANFMRDQVTGATGALASSNEEGVFVERHFNVTPDVLEVVVTSLNDEAETRTPPQIMKIDVEGHELGVLTGGREMLAEHRPIILFETSRDHEEIKKILTDLGYQFHDAETGDPVENPTHNTFALCQHHKWPE